MLDDPGLEADEALESWPLELVALDPLELEFVLVVELLPPVFKAGEELVLDGAELAPPDDGPLELEFEVELAVLEPCESDAEGVVDEEDESLLPPFSEPPEPPTAFRSGQLFAASPGALLI